MQTLATGINTSFLDRLQKSGDNGHVPWSPELLGSREDSVRVIIIISQRQYFLGRLTDAHRDSLFLAATVQ